MNMISKDRIDNYIIKDYDCFPAAEDVLYFYDCTQGKDIIPRVLSFAGNRIIFEYIDGIDGYEFIGSNNNFMPILSKLSHGLAVDIGNKYIRKSLTYEYRMIYMYEHCIGVLKNDINVFGNRDFAEYVLNCIDGLYDYSIKLWKKYFDGNKRFLLHGDLHPGNILRDRFSGKWKAIDPIVTIAPIEFDYVRFVENMTFSHIIAECTTKKQLENQHSDNNKILYYFIDEVLIYFNSSYERFIISLFIDSLLRLMETVIDNEGITGFQDEVSTSLHYCYRIKELIGE